MATAKVEAYAQAMLEVARASGQLAVVEDDLFRFARTFEGSDDSAPRADRPALPVERRIAVIDQLMGGKALATSTALVSMVVAAGQASDLPAIVDRFVELAVVRARATRSPRSAAPSRSTRTRSRRLAPALGKATGKTVEVKVIIDPTVLGGLVAASATRSSTAPSVTASTR